MENIDLEDTLNAGAYHPEEASKSYSTFLNKFAVFTMENCDMKTMISKEHFNDITLAKFFSSLR